MFRKIRRRIAIPFAILIPVVMGGMAVFLLRPLCLAERDCTVRVVVIAAVTLEVGGIILAVVLAERTARPIRQLTEVAKRAAAGDMNARLLLAKRDEVGELVQAFNTMTEQVGERLETLAEEQRQLATVLEYMADGVLIIDELSDVRLINRAAARLLDVSETEALGRSFAEVVRHHQLIELWQRCRDEGKEQIAAVEIGRELFWQVAITPFLERGARSYLVILQDLTTVRRLETVRRDFISNISHELRTPLASLRAVVETLQDSIREEPAVAQRFLSRAEQEVDTLTQMVEELLELSRIESGQVPLQLKPTAVSDLILIPMDRLRTQAERSEIDLILDLPARLPPVLADAERVQQVVSNLLHNAIKFTTPGGKVTVRASLEENEDISEVIVAVKDTGVGIPKQDVTRIFERFYKSDRARTRSQGGTGLGLAISRHIVQAHDGRIWVKSKEGKGSTFYFSLPAATS